jgi:hypothetical protein
VLPVVLNATAHGKPTGNPLFWSTHWESLFPAVMAPAASLAEAICDRYTLEREPRTRRHGNRISLVTSSTIAWSRWLVFSVP